MPTHPVYDMLLNQVTEDLERKVLGVRSTGPASL
jgi:hypothetical protein